MRHLVVALLSLALLSALPTADAQQPTTVARIGGLWAMPLPETAHLVEAFRRGLRELGYVEGRNVALEIRSAETRYERLPGLAAELVRLGVDVIVAPGTEAARAAKNATGMIPR